MNDIDNLTSLYSNAIARAERAEESLRVMKNKIRYLFDLMETQDIQPSDFGEEDEFELLAIRAEVASPAPSKPVKEAAE